MFACIHLPECSSEGTLGAAALAESFSPFVEIIDDRTAVFSITPRQIDQLKKLPRAAVAETIEAAVMAARNFSGVTILPALDALPIDALPPDPEIFETLDMWGIHTLADLAKLPQNGIAERLGPRGIELQKLARGAFHRPLKPVALLTIYEQQIELDYAITQLEPLLFLINRFLVDLCAKLDSQSLAAAALQFTFNREERLLRLPFPTHDVKFLLKLIQHDLESHPLRNPPQKIKLVVLPTVPRRVQHGLFTPAAPEPEKLELTLAKIRALVGTENVKIPELRNSYRPGWSLPDSPLAFRYFRPPIPARVETENGVPKKLFAKTIVNIAGPWRSSGEWWRDDRWSRDEWDLKLADGALFRIFHSEQQWFLEGSYD
jgi:protein ImuB